MIKLVRALLVFSVIFIWSVVLLSRSALVADAQGAATQPVAVASPAAPLTLDMVPVFASVPFLIDIFEVSCVEARSVDAAYCSTSYPDYKPPRLTFEQAREYCKRRGKRLPTVDEWMQAASNLGQNRNYSLRGDSLTDKDGKIQVNIRGGQTIDVANFAKIGIDAIGAVGMTGNRAEWVSQDATHSEVPAQCGGHYDLTRDEDFLLKNLCAVTGDRITADGATTRCVDDQMDKELGFSDRVTGELKTYISQLVGDGNGGSGFAENRNDVFIGKNRYSAPNPAAPTRDPFEKPSPNYIDDN